jgi:hypothetical protein
MSQGRLFVQRKFLSLFGTQFCGALNDNLLKNALVLLVTFDAIDRMGMKIDRVR